MWVKEETLLVDNDSGLFEKEERKTVRMKPLVSEFTEYPLFS